MTSGVTRQQLLTWGAAAEQGSNHPFAKAILQTAAAAGISAPTATATTVMPGVGLEAETEFGLIRVGNREVLTAEDAAAVANEKWPEIPQATTLYLTRDHQLQGAFFVADGIAATSAAAIQALQKQFQVAMVSGDQRSTATAIAAQVGIPDLQVYAGVTPAGKLQIVRELQQTGAKVAMIGDGINDAAALAAADLGIAIGAGAEVALESADIVLLRSDLASAVTTFQLARQTMRVIRQNLAWAWGYNLLLIPFAAGVFIPLWGFHLPPVWAAAAMAVSSVTVVLNSVRGLFQPL
jgi:Cu+-exporting ATPase